jgi:uncharacterized phage infection (PIP) family protein YhgE
MTITNKTPDTQEMGQRMQAFLESLQVKLALGRAELQDLWLEEKKQLMQYLTEQKHQLALRSGELPDKLKEVSEHIRLLESELSETGDKLERTFEDQQPRLKARLQALEASLKSSADALSGEMHGHLDEFRGRMEAMDLRQRLEDTGEDLEAFGEKVREKLPNLWKSLRRKEVSGDVSRELGLAWDHIKKATDELFG